MAKALTFDEIKEIGIIAIFSDDRLTEELVLKGGNAIDIAYGSSWRASLDLDFSMGDDFEPFSKFRARLTRCLETAFLEHDLIAFDIKVDEVPPVITDGVRDFWGGYKIEFKLVTRDVRDKHYKSDEDVRRRALPLHANGSPKFAIDISKHELRDDKTTAELRGFAIPVYSPRMIVCEKLRAICQQMEEYAPVVNRHARPGAPRARDFFDIYVMCEKHDVAFEDEEFGPLLKATFAAKRVPMNLVDSISKAREFHRPDFTSVTATVKPGIDVKDFDFYFDYVIDKCKALETLWEE